MSSDAKPERREYPKSIPCFHCSKSLQQLPRRGNYVGFVIKDEQGFERVLHSDCVKRYLQG